MQSRSRLVFCLVGVLLFFAAWSTTEAVLTDGVYLAANGLNFTCTILNHTSRDTDAQVKEILLLHGFPMFRVWWMPLLEHWDSLLTEEGGENDLPPMSVHAVACDLRGYSPGASPDDIQEYDYSIFAQDAFALAEAAGFGTFHLLGHDHGAALAWYVAGNDPQNKVLSLTTMSVPHIDLISDALCGENVDEAQVIASNYFNQFSLPDSATVNNGSMTEFFATLGLVPGLDPIDVQKMFWWYNGSMTKHFSLPRVVSDAEVDDWESTYGEEPAFFVKGSRAAIPMPERPCVPADETYKVGAIEIPTLFVCGVNDFALLCNRTYATSVPVELIPNYEHVNYECGHDFFYPDACVDMDESQAVWT
jgi:pimeloyl-ACP methyl ester carboxylesterase